MNKLQIFNHPSFGQVEIIDIDGKPWFGASKAASALGYVNPRKAIIDHCRTDGVTKRDAIDNVGRTQEMNFISEGNLYRLITKSKLTNAEKYERWVFDEVLPTIRKTGSYNIEPEKPSYMLDDPIARASKWIEEMKHTQMLEQQTQTLQLKIEADRPKVVFAESLEVSSNSILIGQLAKLLKQNGIDIGQNRLFEILRRDGYLMRNGSDNVPTQRSMDLKIMEIKVGTRLSSSDGTKSTFTPKITGKGQFYFINKFKSLQQAN